MKYLLFIYYSEGEKTEDDIYQIAEELAPIVDSDEIKYVYGPSHVVFNFVTEMSQSELSMYVDIITEFYPERVLTRFKVVRAEFNPDVVYEKVYFDTDTTIDGVNPNDYYVNWNYAIFDDCNESIQNYKLDVYNDFTGSTECECNTISVTNTGTTRQSFTYVDCSGVTSSYSVASGSTISVCGCYKTFRGSSFIFCPQIEVVGCDVTPLPTPTPTPVPPNVLNWYFSKDLGEYNPNVTDPVSSIIDK